MPPFILAMLSHLKILLYRAMRQAPRRKRRGQPMYGGQGGSGKQQEIPHQAGGKMESGREVKSQRRRSMRRSLQ